MIVLHHLENSISVRIIWLLEELGAPYEIKTYAREANFLAPASYKALHPAGISPIITDGDVTIAETNAIVDYLLDKYPESPLRPAPNTAERVPYLYWFHASQGSFAPMLLMRFVFGKMVQKSPFVIDKIVAAVTSQVEKMLVTPRINNTLSAMNDTLATSPWLAGEAFTAADILMGQLIDMQAKKLDFSAYPNIEDYLERIRARDAFQRAMEKGGGLSF